MRLCEPMKLQALLLCLITGGCTINAPMYDPSADNANLLQDSGAGNVRVEPIRTSSPEEHGRISMRAGSMKSPYGITYADYLTKALEEELKLAGVWSSGSNTIISGELIENDVDISGISEGHAHIKARFRITRSEQTIYDRALRADLGFESSFVGAIAIENGMNAYPKVIQKLIRMLFSDKDFIEAIR